MIILSPGRVVGGKYRLEHKLGAGGMGSVWAARHQQLDAPVALKVIDPNAASSAEARSRFEREARTSAQIRNPHVVQVLDYGVEDGTPYLVMERLDGHDLRDLLRRAGRLSLVEAAHLLIQVCKGLSHAHALGIVHRDLKPANIFLARADGEEIVKILDFGIAKELGLGPADQVTQTGSLIGTPHFMSPEQAMHSEALDHRSDLWSLGVILFECLTGRLPFPGSEITAVLLKLCNDPIPVPSQVAPHLGPAVDRFFQKALARDREQRFQSARAMAEAFAAVAGVPFDRTLIAGASRVEPLPALPASLGGGTVLLDSAAPIAPRAAASMSAGGTLAPAGRSHSPSPRARGPLLRAIGVAAGVIALGAAVTLLALHARHTPDRPHTDIDAPARAPAAAPLPEPEPPAPTVTVAEPAPSAAPANSASARPAPTTPPPPKPTATPGVARPAPKASAQPAAPSMFGF